MREQDLDLMASELGNANRDIAEQNSRYDLTGEISDAEFRDIAISGLSAQQQRSHDQRRDTLATVDFPAVLNEWESLLANRSEVEEKHQAVTSRIEAITAQAALTLEIMPSAADDIERLSAQKIQQEQSTLTQLEREIGQLKDRELGYVALCQPWKIPRLPISLNATATEPIALQTPVQPEASDASATPTPETAEPELSPAETDFNKALWAVFEYANQSGSTGVRIEEMRKAVPELAELTPAQYAYFKNNFSEMRSRIQDLLARMDVEVEWTTSGQTRGTRYHLSVADNQHGTITQRRRISGCLETQPKALATPPAQRPQTPDNQAGDTTTPFVKDVAATQPITPALPVPTTAAGSESNLTAPSSQEPEQLSKSAEVLEEAPLIRFAKYSVSTSDSAKILVIEAPLAELTKHLRIKKDPQFVREAKKWIEWLTENPRTGASRKIHAFKGIRFNGDAHLTPLYRFAPKDATSLRVPRQYLRHRVVYAMVDENIVLLDILDHDSFDTKYN